MAEVSITGAGAALGVNATDHIPATQSGNSCYITPSQIKAYLDLAAVATSGSASDLASGTLPSARLPNPAADTKGGVESLTAPTHQFLKAINTDGTVTASQPASTDLSDGTTAGVAMFTAATVAAQTALLDAFTGDGGEGGVKGLVPAPTTGDVNKLLAGSATWVAAPTSALWQLTTYPSATSAAISLTGQKWMPRQTIDSAITFTVASNPVAGGFCYLRLIADGTNAPNFSAFKEASNSSGWVNTASVDNQISFWYDGTDAWISITQAIPWAP